MNNSWLENVLINFFKNHVHLFGEQSTYLGFQANERNKNSTQTAPDGFNSALLQGKIVYKDKQGDVHNSIPIFIKVMPDPDLISEFLSFSYANEMNFYTKIVPTFGTFDPSIYSLFPKFYHGEMMYDEMQTRSAIIFEDLTAKGYKLAEKKSFLNFEHLALMMGKLGQFHAYSYKVKGALPHWFSSMAKSFQETDFFLAEGKDLLGPFAERGFAALDKDFKNVLDLKIFLKNADKIFTQVLTGDKENPISVITHGDYLRNNVMFRYAENSNTPDDLRIIDMAMRRCGSPVIDLANVLYINADQVTRDKYWDKLIDVYYTALKETFPDNNEVPSKNAILKEFVGKSFYTYLVASYFLPRLIANDNKIPYPKDIDPDIGRKFDELQMGEIPREMWIKLYSAIGGEQGTKALKDILEDMMKRGFICRGVT